MKQIYKNPFTLKMFRAQLAAAASPGFVQQMHANQVKLSLEVADEIIRQVGL
jgi:alpha-D-ribose 1-methylphosphonate 5-triphosphate synthase subunit PhnH